MSAAFVGSDASMARDFADIPIAKKAGTKKESWAVHMYLPLVIYAGQFDPIDSGFVFKVSDDSCWLLQRSQEL